MLPVIRVTGSITWNFRTFDEDGCKTLHLLLLTHLHKAQVIEEFSAFAFHL
jgi:hypothetical protein